jgi:hypothetical protein
MRAYPRHGLKQRLQRFMAKRGEQAMEHAEQLEDGSMVHGINAAWLQVSGATGGARGSRFCRQ